MAIPAGFSQHASGTWMKASDQSGPYLFDGTNMVPLNASYPLGATPVTQSSGSVANAPAVANLAAAAGKTTYISGFIVTSSGATAAAVVSITIGNLLGGSAFFTYSAVAGATLGNPSLQVNFPQPLPANAAAVSLVITLPALGAGNTNATVTAYGFQL